MLGLGLANSRFTEVQRRVAEALKSQRAELDDLKARNAQLESENQSLNGKLDSSLERAKEYKVHLRHMNTRCKELKDARDEALAVANERKKEVDSWALAVDKLQQKLRKQKSNGQKNGSQATPTPSRAEATPRISETTRQQRRVEVADAPPRLESKASFVSVASSSFSEGVTSRIEPEAFKRAASVPAVLGNETALAVVPPAQQLTQDDPEPDLIDRQPSPELPPENPQTLKETVKVKEEPSSDGPVVVFERPVKRKNADRGEEETSSRIRRLKREASSSELNVLSTLR